MRVAIVSMLVACALAQVAQAQDAGISDAGTVTADTQPSTPVTPPTAPPAAAPAPAPATAAAEPAPGRLDFAVPDGPAFTLLGVTPTTVSRASSFQEWAAAAATGIDTSGKIQSGVAAEWSPTLSGNSTLALSLATNVKSPMMGGNAAIGQMALGFRFSWRSYNPDDDHVLRRCLGAALPAPTAPPDQIPVGGETATAFSAEQSFPLGQQCRAAATAAHLARWFFEAAVASAAEAPNAMPGDGINFYGATAWMHGSLYIWNLEAHPELRDTDSRAFVAAQKGFLLSGFTRLNVLRYSTSDSYRGELYTGLRVEFFADSWNLFLEGAVRPPVFGDRDPTQPLDSGTNGHIAIGGEFRLSNGVWLALSFGSDVVDPVTQRFTAARFFTLANFHWSQGSGPTFDAGASQTPH